MSKDALAGGPRCRRSVAGRPSDSAGRPAVNNATSSRLSVSGRRIMSAFARSRASRWSGWFSDSSAGFTSRNSTASNVSGAAASGSHDLRFLFGDIIAIEAVEARIAIAMRGQDRFPSIPSRRERIGRKRLDHHDFRPEAFPVAAADHVVLGAFDIDFQELERGRCMLLAKRFKRGHRHGHRLRRLAEFAFRLARMIGDHGREAVKVIDEMELRRTLGRPHKRLDIAVARAHAVGELRQRRIGLDRDPAPALQIEGERDIVIDRMTGADIDIEAVPFVREAAAEIKVFEPLRIRRERRHRVRHCDYLSRP